MAIQISVVRRINSTEKAMSDISRGGGLENQLSEKGEDELTNLAISFNHFVNNIKTVVDLVMYSSSNLAQEATKMKTITS